MPTGHPCDALLAVAGPDGGLDPAAVQATVAEIGQRRLPAWVEHVKDVLADLDAQRRRALDLRNFLDERYPPGNAARRLLDALLGEGATGSTAQAPVAGCGGPGGSAPPREPAPGPQRGEIASILRSEVPGHST